MPRRDTDRNLLFGILALQMDFISRDALVAAMNAWVLEKHRPIGEILVERKALDPSDRGLLEPMVDRHVAKHDNDPAASLAAVSSIETLAQELLPRLEDPEVRQSLAQISTESSFDPHATRAPAESPDLTPSGVRYRKVRDHAEGGLGVVFVARDNELNREVALKEIKTKYADNPSSQARFLIEAEITGGLEHPGIVPVYGLGHYDDGRPYYAMRFIRGDSLKQSINTFHNDPALKKDPGARTLALQKLLRRFLDVCNAVAYAHSRGVLHRDLKPDNVMVGQYGETLVVDWGLAKAVGRSGGDDFGAIPEATLLSSPKSGSNQTMAGSIIGTPAYMSPEQAAGRLDLLGPASDVYSLGATLYSLLTARVPIEGKDVIEVLRKVERGDFARPREISPWLDPALEAICLTAMALRLEARYASPRALADDIEKWLADEPVTAYREPISRRARRWARKHRTALTGLAAASLIACLALGGFAWLKYDQRRKIDASALSSLNKADDLAIEARIKGELPLWDKAINEIRLAENELQAGNGSPSLQREVTDRLAAFSAEQGRRLEIVEAENRDRRMILALEEARLLSANVEEDSFDFKSKLDAYLAAFQTYGIDLTSLSVEETARRIRSSPIADDLITALDDWLQSKDLGKVPRSRLSEIARAGETDPLRAAIRDCVSRKDVVALRRMCESSDVRRKLGPRLRTVFNSLIHVDPEASFPLLETIRQEYPADFWFNEDLGQAYANAKKPRLDDAVRCHSIAIALKPDSTAVHTNLGIALKAQGKIEAAIEEYEQAIRIKPDNAFAHNNLGNILRIQGKLEAAIEEFQKAIHFKPGYAQAHTNLGNTLHDQGKTEAAIEEYQTAIRIKPDFVPAHTYLGHALRIQGKIEAAIEEYQKVIRIKPDYAQAHTNLGIALHEQGKIEPAIEEYQKAIRIKPDDARAHSNLGNILKSQGKIEPAIEEFQQAIRIKPDYPQALCGLGLALQSKGLYPDALKNLERGHELGSRQPDWHFPSATWVDHARRLVELEAKALAILQGKATARDSAERLTLADVCHKTGRYASAVRFDDEAFADAPSLAHDPIKGYRYNAACSASLAASGTTRDDPAPDESAKVKLREKALAWLKADLAAWAKILDSGHEPARKQAVLKKMAHWKEAADLAGIREEAALNKLPEAERVRWENLWRDVEALRKRAAEE